MQAEVVVLATQITESVPALPAVAVLILMVLVNPLLRRLGPRAAFTRAEIFIIYAFLLVTTTLAGCGIIRFFFALLPVVFYFDTPENRLETLQGDLPTWLVPHDRELIRKLYEGVEAGEPIPWGAWVKPLTVWTFFFLLLWLTMLCLVVLIRRQWVERERLAFPLLQLPLEMVPPDPTLSAGGERRRGIGTALASGRGAGGLLPAFFRNPIMWMGFALAALYNLLNIAHAFNPAVVAPGKYFNLGALFTERPWSAVQPLVLHYRPEMVGFGYLVSTEVSFSIWVFFLFTKLQAILCDIAAYDVAGRPFVQEQSLGAYLALALFLLWIARRHLREVWRGMGRPLEREQTEPLPYRWAGAGLVVGFVGLVVFCWRAGMMAWVAATYLLLVLAVAFVYTRIRGEAGIPLIWMFPYYQQKKALLYTLGSAPLMPQGETRTLTLFALLTFLSRGYFPSTMGYQLENLKLAEEGRIRARAMVLVLVLSLVVGLVVSYGLHLWPFYTYGAGTLRGGIWGTGIAISEYQMVVTYTEAPQARDPARIVASAFGFVLTTALMVLRLIFLRFPLHPLGYCMATAYGTLIWWSFFFVWLCKVAIFRLGGVRLYRRLIPGFIGFALGHFFTAGLVWGWWSTLGGALGSDEVFRRYGVWFG